MSIERSIIKKLFESRVLDESSFELGGKKYSCVFGRYSCDGEEISRDDYMKAREQVEGTTSSSTSQSISPSRDVFSYIEEEDSFLRDVLSGEEELDNILKYDFDREYFLEELEDAIGKAAKDKNKEVLAQLVALDKKATKLARQYEEDEEGYSRDDYRQRPYAFDPKPASYSSRFTY